MAHKLNIEIHTINYCCFYNGVFLDKGEQLLMNAVKINKITEAD